MASYRALHDYTNQERALRILLLSPRSDEPRQPADERERSPAFELPNSRDLPQAFDLAGTPTFDSTHLNDTQNEQEYYTVVSYQKTDDKALLPALRFHPLRTDFLQPDSTGDLIFNGVASGIYNSYLTNGVQFDGSYIVNDQHTVRGGIRRGLHRREIRLDDRRVSRRCDRRTNLGCALLHFTMNRQTMRWRRGSIYRTNGESRRR